MGESLARARCKSSFDVAIVAALITLLLASALNVYALTGTNLQPDAHGYTATAYMLVTWQGVHTVLLIFMGAYTLARHTGGQARCRATQHLR